MMEEVEDMKKKGSSVNDSLVIEAEQLFLLAWEPTKSLKEHRDLFKYPDDDYFDGLVRKTTESLVR